MLTIWLQSIMTAAVATKSTGKSRRVKVLSNEYREKQHDLMKQGLAHVWQDFVREFPGEISKQESHTVDMIILIRNQLAHCHISSGNEFALFLPRPSVTPGSGASRNLHGCSGARQLPALTSEDLRSRLIPVEVESPSL